VLNMMLANEETADDDARYVLRWIERHGRLEFTKSEAQHHGKRRFHKPADQALAELVWRGLYPPRPAVGRSRSAFVAHLEVNPAVFENANPEMRSHNSHNATHPFGSGGSEHIESAIEPTENTNRMRVTI
jgi:hypothetical protein